MTTPKDPKDDTRPVTPAAAGVLAQVETAGMLDISVQRSPEQVLEEAHRAARALKAVIDAKPKKVVFNNETYLEFEDWQTVGRFYAISPRIVNTKYVEYGFVTGWEATAEAVYIPTGQVIASAEAMCLNDEEKWRARPKYEWHYVKKSGGTSAEDPGRSELIWEGEDGKKKPKKTRVLVGEEAVPLFQLRSMAQTRAGAKALRNALAWVVVLAGYKPTPAEELPGRAEGVEDAEIVQHANGDAERSSAIPAQGPFADGAGTPQPHDPRPALAEELMKTLASFDPKPTANQWARITGFFTGTSRPMQADAFAQVDPAALADLRDFLKAMHGGEAAALKKWKAEVSKWTP